MNTSCKLAQNHQSKYWKNKPIVMFGDRPRNVFEQIKSDNEIKEKCKSFTTLPDGYTWGKIDVSDPELNKVCDFLNKHYCRGSESEYIVSYDQDRLRWELYNGYFLTVLNQTGDIIGTVGYSFKTVQLGDSKHTITEPMYLCCLKQYRGTGIAKVLIDEVIRQSASYGVTKGVFNTNRVVTKPMATIRQYSRPLNYKKLREHDFVEVHGVDDDMIHNKLKINLKPDKRYVVAEKTDENIDIVHKLYNEYMSTFTVHNVLSRDEIIHYFFDGRYVKTLLVTDQDKVVDFITYYFYDIVDTNKTESDNIIKASNILMYSSNSTRVDLLFINALKQISYDKIHIVYINDVMHNNDVILSNIKNADEDTDDEEEGASYDMNIVKTAKKTFLSAFNINIEPLKQNMVSWLIF